MPRFHSCFLFQQRFHAGMAVLSDFGNETLHPLKKLLIDICFCFLYAGKLCGIAEPFLEFFGFDIQPLRQGKHFSAPIHSDKTAPVAFG